MSLAQLFYLRESIRNRCRRAARRTAAPRSNRFTMEPLENRLLLSVTPVAPELTNVVQNATNLEPNPVTQSAGTNQVVSFQLDYQDTGTSGATGLGLRIHYDSRQLRGGEAGADAQFGTTDDIATLTNLISTGPTTIFNGIQDQADTGNFDNNTNTDRFVLIAWSDFTGGFPKGPAVLLVANFTTTDNFTGTTINFTTSSRPVGRGLNATPATITFNDPIRESVPGQPVTIVGPAGSLISGVTAIATPPNAPPDVTFPFGFFGFTVQDNPNVAGTALTAGGSITVDVLLPSDANPNTYWKFGPEAGNTTPHFYEFLFDGTTGAQFENDVDIDPGAGVTLADRIRLTFVDGGRGDADGLANGIIVDPGAPGVETVVSNSPPSGADKTITIDEDGQYIFAAADFGFSDPDVGDALNAVRIDTLPGLGSLTAGGNAVLAGDVILTADISTLVYTPVANGNGSPYASFTFSVRDSADAFDPTPNTITFNVTAVNDAPVLDPAKTLTLNGVDEDAPAPVGAVGTLVSALADLLDGSGLDNVTDADLAAVTGIAVVGLNDAQGSLFWSFDNGASWLQGSGFTTAAALLLPSNARVYFQPRANVNGPIVDAMTIRAWDQTSGIIGSVGNTTVNGGTTAFSTVTDTVSITVAAVNDAPVLGAIGNKAVDEGATVSFTATATDVDAGQTRSFALDTAALALGATIDAATGAFSWTPTEAQGPGTYDVTITVTDNGTPALSDSETIQITVSEVNQNPVLGAIGNRTVDEGATLTFTIGGTDADLPANVLTFSASNLPTGASFDPATRTFSWTPTEAQGPGLFTDILFTVSDGQGGTDSETISITVNEVNQAPVLGAIGNRSVQVGQTVSFTVTATDGDVPANLLSLSSSTLPTGATFTTATGAFSWTPTAGQVGDTEFTFTVTDNGSPILSDSETLTITVTADTGNRNPIAVDDQASTDKNVPVTLNVLANDSDPDGDPLVIDSVTDPAHGTIEIQGACLVYTPNQGFTGQDSVVYTVSDGKGGIDTAIFSVTVVESVVSFTVAPPVLEYQGTVNGPNQTAGVTVTNTGETSLTVTWHDSIFWLVETSGDIVTIAAGESAVITHTASMAGLAAGIYTGTATISGGGITEIINVTLTVVEPVVSFTVAPPVLEYQGTVNGPNQTAGVTVTNTGETSLTVTWHDSIFWLVETSGDIVTIAAGESAVITHTASMAGLAAGVYTGTATISGGGITEIISVTLTVVEPVVSFTVAPPVLEYQGTVNGPNQTAGVTVTNTGETSLTVTWHDSIFWLVETSGDIVTIAAGASAVISHTASMAGLAAGVYTGTATISGGGITEIISVTLTVVEPVVTEPLIIRGTGQDDVIRIEETCGGLVSVWLNGQQREYRLGDGTRITVLGLGGDDMITLSGLTRDTTVEGGNGHDLIDGRNVKLADLTLKGGNGNDILLGGKGHDLLEGGNGNDILLGGGGEDTLRGGNGHDVLVGGKGEDRLLGGNGHDFLFQGSVRGALQEFGNGSSHPQIAQNLLWWQNKSTDTQRAWVRDFIAGF